MFRTDITGLMQINKGDTGETVFYVNAGSPLCDYLYSFGGNIKVGLSQNIKNYDIEIDRQTWTNKVIDAGVYQFIWDISNAYWTLNAEEVEIAEYGISLPNITPSKIPDGAKITIEYTLCNSDSEIYFYVWQPLQQMGEVPVMKKTIKPYSNTVITEIEGKEISIEHRNCTDIYGNPILHFNPEDTENIPQGEYRYQVRAKLYEQGDYILNTVCNRTPFLIIEDDYQDRIW